MIRVLTALALFLVALMLSGCAESLQAAQGLSIGQILSVALIVLIICFGVGVATHGWPWQSSPPRKPDLSKDDLDDEDF